MQNPIMILHGWARAGKEKKYDVLKEILEDKGYRVYLPDLPGFGANIAKKEDLTFDDYIQFLADFIKEKNLKKVILLGHSFGGRIAIRYTALHPEIVEKLILTGASGIPHPLPSLKKKIIFIATKITRPIFLLPPFSLFYKLFRKAVYYSLGEMDYYQAGSLAQTFKNVYKVSIADNLERINNPTLLLWGENDTITPLVDGQYMQAQLKNSKLVVIPNATHKLPYEKPLEFAQAVVRFL